MTETQTEIDEAQAEVDAAQENEKTFIVKNRRERRAMGLRNPAKYRTTWGRGHLAPHPLRGKSPAPKPAKTPEIKDETHAWLEAA